MSNPHHYRLDPNERISIDAFLAPGTPVAYLGDTDWNRAWSILHEEPGRIVLEHWNRALADVEVKGGAVVAHTILEGDEAKALRARYVTESE